jgi:hypothetical protein
MFSVRDQSPLRTHSSTRSHYRQANLQNGTFSATESRHLTTPWLNDESTLAVTTALENRIKQLKELPNPTPRDTHELSKAEYALRDHTTIGASRQLLGEATRDSLLEFTGSSWPNISPEAKAETLKNLLETSLTLTPDKRAALQEIEITSPINRHGQTRLIPTEWPGVHSLTTDPKEFNVLNASKYLDGMSAEIRAHAIQSLAESAYENSENIQNSQILRMPEIPQATNITPIVA